MMMSAPSPFCIAMLSSGVSSMRLPSTGDWNSTPRSVMSARCSSDTIWKPPLSVSIPRGQFMNPCSPPMLSTSSCPGWLPRW